ncbi:hypothetical protein [Alienimonas californiensis]|uniref:Uncharacterized protein n=1 Tax=Alienimonas californiensis TaxID=2527989 RepID=A0A517PBI3_9PLAN|nr:hypothetical protein [Alienimonas californiensis]QDT16745.1 hypothetical protein CA12_28520 [Alienimonas californiensis]
MSNNLPALAGPAAPTAQFVCHPAPDGPTVNAFLFDPDGRDVLLTDEINAISADARADLLDRFAEAALAEGHPFDRDAAERDLITQGGEAARRAASQPAARMADPAALLSRVGLTVVGERADGAAVTHSESTGRTRTTPRVAKLEFEDALQLVGSDHAGRLVRKRTNDTPPGAISLPELKGALALAASAAPEIDSGGRGRGVWPGEGGDLLINDGRTVYTYDGLQTADFADHAVGGHAVLRGGAEWAGSDVRAAVDGMTPDRAAAAYSRLLEITGQWRWERPADAAVAAAAVVATPVQAVLRHRPRMAVLGPTNSGKSTLVTEALTPLLSGPHRFAEIFDDATAAGVRQSVGCDAPPVVLDEFENSSRREGILAMFRVASRGGRMVRGTPGQVAHETELRLMPWVLAIEPGDLPAQDRNRQIELELAAPPADSPDPELPSVEELHELRVELVAAAVWAVRAAEDLALAIRRLAPADADRRLVESLAVPAAFDAVLRHGRDVAPDVAGKVLRSFLEGRTVDDTASTEQDLLDAIFSAPITVPGMNKKVVSVGELVAEQFTGHTTWLGMGAEQLGLNGLRVFHHPRAASGDRPACDRGLFVTPLVATTLLEGTSWQGVDVKTILKRLPGACEDNQAVNGRPTRGVFLPLGALGLCGTLPAADPAATSDKDTLAITG